MSVLYDKLFPVFYTPLKTLLKIFASIIFVALILAPCVIFLGDVDTDPSSKSFGNNSSSKKIIKNIQQVKTILYWTRMFDSKTFYFENSNEIFKNCEVSACRATYDRNLMKIDQFDAILFHGLETRYSDLPPARSIHQKYVFVDLESPANYNLQAAYIPDQFYNWTMTYRRDSDIHRAYGYIVNHMTEEIAFPIWASENKSLVNDNLNSDENVGIFKGYYSKRKSAAWFVSHCRTSGLRDRYVDELKKYVDIDIYGKCGPYFCKSGNSKCYEMLENRYHFYIAFENSLCEDYVTEKLYKVMSYDVVPIVYGAVNYTEFAPPGSYINVADFDSPKYLANYLNRLMNDREEYGKYFLWKKYYYVDLSHRVTLCNFCKILHDENELSHSNIGDLRKWWFEGKCQDPVKFLGKIIGE